MSELFSWLKFFLNAIFSAIFGIVLPYLFVPFIGQYVSIFNYELILVNGVIYVCAYSLLGLFKKDTYIRFIIGLGYIGLLIYFYTVGNNFFTFYLPHTGFGQIYLSETIEGSTISFGYNYSWVAIVLIILIGVSTFRKFIKPRKEKREEEKFKESKG
jgi:hypothetical protein